MIKNCHQIWISDTDEIPPIIAKQIAFTRNMVGDANYKLWTKKEAVQLLADLDHNLLNTFNRIVPQAYKADFLRYILIYGFGGLYIDTMTRLNIAYSNIVDTNKILVFKDYFAVNHAPWNVSNGFFYFPEAGSKVLYMCIEKIIENVDTNFYGNDWLEPTGPGMFGKQLSQYSNDDAFIFGEYIPLTPFREKKNFAYVIGSGDIVAFGKPTSGTGQASLTAMGVGGVKEYGELWRRREIYSGSHTK